MRPFAWVGLCLGIGACTPITEPAGSDAPANVCGGTSGLTCAAYSVKDAGAQCETVSAGGACQVDTIGSFVLVVTVPSLAPFSGGATYALSASQLFPVATINKCGQKNAPPAGETCFRLALLDTGEGGYTVTPQQAAEAGRYVGAVLGEPSVTLPVSATFWPLWTPPDTPTSTGVTTDARLLNLPLPAVLATAGCSSLVNVAGGLESCQYQNPFAWVAGLAPSLATPSYVGTVKVAAPFDDAYPDFSYEFGAAQSTDMQGISYKATLIGYTIVPQPPRVIARADGEPWTGGWTAYFRDPVTHLALSSHAALEGKSPTVHLNYMGPGNPVLPAAAELVIEPPPGMPGLPEFIDTDTTVTTNESYPALPPVVHVSGTIVSPYGSAVSATLVFYSDAIDDVATCMSGSSQGNPIRANLDYETVAKTDDQLTTTGAVGSYHVDLPQGDYVVVVQPNEASGYAKTTHANLAQHIAVTPAVCSGAPPSLGGVSITVSLPVTVSGSVRTADGRPLASADVDFTPSAALAYARFSTPVAEDEWPRPFTTTTGIDGTFSVNVDPFGYYDMTVRPQDGTGFPWLVRSDHAFTLKGTGDGGSAVDGGATASVATTATQIAQLEPLVVPAPYFLSLTLHDFYDNPLAGAVVQAYAFDGPASSSPSPFALLIGEALADADGHFTMALTTSFASN